jgi:hypothetical protein
MTAAEMARIMRTHQAALRAVQKVQPVVTKAAPVMAHLQTMAAAIEQARQFQPQLENARRLIEAERRDRRRTGCEGRHTRPIGIRRLRRGHG